MAKAAKAPPSLYKRRFYVTDHVRNQMRARYNADTKFRDDEDLMNLIDFAAHNAWDKSSDIEDEGVRAKVLPLYETLDEDLWVLVKPNTMKLGSAKFNYALITVLEEDMCRRSLETGKWKIIQAIPELKKLAPLFNLSDQNMDRLRDVVIKTHKEESDNYKMPTVDFINKSKTKGGRKTESTMKNKSTVLLSWWSTSANERIYEEYDDKENAEKRLNELMIHPHCKSGSIQAWAPIQYKVTL